MAKKKSVDVAEEIVLADGEELTVADITLDDDLSEISAVVAEIETDEVKREAYAEQPADPKAEALSVETPAVKTKAPKAPRLSMVSMKASDILTNASLAMGGITLLTDGTKMDGVMMDAVDKLDKKTREKAVNLVMAMQTGKRPSVYTVQAVKAARAAGGTLSLKGLTDFYLTTCGYKIGTARRQASEMFALFPAFAIASKEPVKGSPLVLNPESVVLAFIEAASAPVAASA